MNNKTYLYSYILTLIGGILLVALHGRAGLFNAITVTVGVLLLVPGVLAFIRAAFPSRTARMAGARPSVPMIAVSLASVVLGVMLVAVPEMFTHFIVYAFGILMIVCGVVQFLNFSPSRRSLGFPWWYMAAPALCICIGVVVMVLGAAQVLDILAMLTGIVLIVYSLNGFIGYYERSKRSHQGGVTGKVVNVEM